MCARLSSGITLSLLGTLRSLSAQKIKQNNNKGLKQLLFLKVWASEVLHFANIHITTKYMKLKQWVKILDKLQHMIVHGHKQEILSKSNDTSFLQIF